LSHHAAVSAGSPPRGDCYLSADEVSAPFLYFTAKPIAPKGNVS
jgi:hypothetical protein